MFKVNAANDLQMMNWFVGIEQPNKPKLRMMLKVPQYNNIRPPRMQKRLILMRGPEVEQNKKYKLLDHLLLNMVFV